MEMEFFVEPGTDEKWHEYWLQERWNWYLDLGLSEANLRFYEHPKEKLSHYSKRTVDIEYRFRSAAREFSELEGIANRTDFDLTTHSKHSGVDLSYFDQDKKERWVPVRDRAGRRPHPRGAGVPARGVRRGRGARTPRAASTSARSCASTRGSRRSRSAVLPLSRNPDLSPKARDLAAALRKRWIVEFDDAQAIGRRYRRQDEIGTPFCVTVDFDTLQDDAVTVRDRDTMTQERVSLDQVERYLLERLLGPR